MMYCVDIRQITDGNTVKTILETTDPDVAYAKAKEWNEQHGVTDDDVEAYYNEDWLVDQNGMREYFADVYHDETR